MVISVPDVAVSAWLSLADALADRGPAPCETSAFPDAWFVPALEALAKGECAGCPVREVCGRYAVAAGELHGVWVACHLRSGGLMMSRREVDPAEAFAGLMVLIEIATRAKSAVKVPAVVLDLLAELQADAQTKRISATGSESVRDETISDMGNDVSPEEAGQAVGLTSRRVRQLCAAGLVEHRIIHGGRYLVNPESLREYMRNSRSRNQTRKVA